MNTQRTIFAAVVAVVFLFAGYNLYNYFSNQSEIQAQKELESQKIVAEREKREAEKAEARQQAQAERKREQQKEERLAAERRATQQAKREKEKGRRAPTSKNSTGSNSQTYRGNICRYHCTFEQCLSPIHTG